MVNIEQRVINVIATILEKEPESIPVDAEFDALELDSMAQVMIVNDLEEEFGIEIPQDKVYTIESVPELVEGIKTLLDRAQAAESPE